jgi:type VI secretion system protein ImpH
MAAESGTTSNPLVDVLFEEPYRFDFFQAVRLLERIDRRRFPIGRYGEPANEAVRFRTRVSLGFPPSQIFDLQETDEGESTPPEMMVAFMGLTGPAGVLPHHYTELLVERTRYKDTAAWDFLDLFNHRMISLFYRAWEKYRFAVAYERGEDRFTEFLFDIVGMGTRGLRGRQSFKDEAMLFYGGLFAQRPHSASAMAAVLSDYFGVGSTVDQFPGQWLKLDEESLTRLGGASAELGVTTVAGTRVWDVQSKFQLRFGPLTYAEFVAFLPTGSAFKPAADLTRLIAGQEFDFDIRLTIKAEEVPACVLTTKSKRSASLGWTTWLKSKPFSEDDSQVVLSVLN